MRITAYQVLSIARCMGHTDIIPDTFVYGTPEQAQEDIKNRLEFFNKNNEKAEFKGTISTLKEIQNIFADREACMASFLEEQTDFYIYEVEVLV